MINLSNYEEYFILYTDNELSAGQKQMVDDFLLLHPHLAEELETLMNTKLPVDDVLFNGKAELHSSAMKLNVVDELLLLYIDNELSATEKGNVEERLKNDKDYYLQHSLLLQTKLDASEEIKHPNKKELYRHTEKVIAIKTWMKIAVAVVIILFASLFFIMNSDNKPVNADSTNPSYVQNKPTTPSSKKNTTEEKQSPVNSDQTASITTKDKQEKQDVVAKANDALTKPQQLKPTPPDVQAVVADVQNKKEIVRFSVGKFGAANEIDKSIAFNSFPAISPVTSLLNKRTIIPEPNGDTADPVDFEETKKTPAKGFLRKVSRLIERRTGIAAVNDDNELLIGAVALKLK